MNQKRSLVDCVKDFYRMGLTTSVSGNYSIRIDNSWIWITPNGIPRYRITQEDIVKLNIETGESIGKQKPTTEWQMHSLIYRKNNYKDNGINAVIHTHSPYTVALSISDEFMNIIEESKVIVGKPLIVENKPSGSLELAQIVSESLKDGIHALIIRNHGIVTVGKDIHHARAVVEALEEWSKILAISKIFGGPKFVL